MSIACVRVSKYFSFSLCFYACYHHHRHFPTYIMHVCLKQILCFAPDLLTYLRIRIHHSRNALHAHDVREGDERGDAPEAQEPKSPADRGECVGLRCRGQVPG